MIKVTIGTNTNRKSITLNPDTTIREALEANNIDCVVHLAAMAGVRPSIENPTLYQEVNCLGTQNILESGNCF